MALELHLPWPPTENGAYDVSPVITSVAVVRMAAAYHSYGAGAAIRVGMGLIRGGWRLGKRGRDYCHTVASHVGHVEAIEGPIQVVHDFWPPDSRRRDLYNHHKVLHDALTKAGVWKDDSQIVQGADYWHPAKRPGGVRIVIEELQA